MLTYTDKLFLAGLTMMIVAAASEVYVLAFLGVSLVVISELYALWRCRT